MSARRTALVCCLGLTAAVFPGRAAGKVFPASAFSNKAAGTTGAVFLKLPASARVMALGSAYTAGANGSEAIFWNPAGLARMQAAGLDDFSFSYNHLLETSYASTLAYAHPFSEERGVFATSLIFFSQSAIRGYSPLGDPDGEFKPYDFALAGAYARRLGRLGLGSTLKVIRSKLSDASGTSFALDLGLQLERVTDVGEGAMDIGLSLTNLGPPIRMGSVADPLPFKLQLGALWHVSPRLQTSLDGHLPVDESPYASMGAEFAQPLGQEMLLSIRAGYNVRNERDVDGLTGFTAGFGFGLRPLRIDYAWVPLGDLGMTHRISIGYTF
ncbi:MAG: PorV/PorQ family protein [Elusimicrobiota bacterium]